MLTVKNALFKCVYYVSDILLEVLFICCTYVFYGLYNDAWSSLE